MIDKYYFDCEREMLCNEDGDVFVAVIWPTAIAYENEIIKIINDFPDVYLYEKKYITLKKEDLLWIMYWMYHLDWIPPRIVEEKCEVISQRIKGKSCDIIFLKLLSKDNIYTINSRNHRKQSTIICTLKYKIRQKIKHNIDNYIHDIIVHISDDGFQSDALMGLIDFLEIMKLNNNIFDGYDYNGRYLTVRLREKIAFVDEIKKDWLILEFGGNGR